MAGKVISHNDDVIQAIAGIYNTMHYFDLSKNTCEEYYAFKEVHDFFEAHSEMDLQTLLHAIFKVTATEEYLQGILDFTDFKTLGIRTKDRKVLSYDFLGKIHGWTRASLIPISYDDEGNLVSFVFTTRIINAEKNKEDELRHIAETDALTGVYNRHAYEKDLADIEKAGLNFMFTIISFDVNGLKIINDNHGHAAGDELIKGAAECLKETFGDRGKIYRKAGDEFSVLIECSATDLVNYFGIFESKTAAWKGNLVKELTCAYGWSAHGEYPEFTVSELEKKADRRMYKKKEEFYRLRGIDYSKYVKNPEMVSQIMTKSNMGLVSLIYDEDSLPKLIVDDYIKDFMDVGDTLSPEECFNQWYGHIHPDYLDSVSAAIEKIIIGSQAEVQYPWYHPKIGIAYIRSSGFRDSNYTKGIRINGYFQVITNLIHLQKDSLTGFYTKEFFFQLAEEILAKNPDKDYKIFVSDVENFKSINEKYGIETADKLLKYLAKSEKIFLPKLILTGRITADKFVCLQEVTEAQTREQGLKVQHEILKNAPVPNVVWKHGIYYTKYDRTISVQKMCDRARMAVESIKGDYEVYCALYNEDLAQKLNTQRQIVENMEDALSKDEFKIYLQPKHDLKTNKTGGAEALVRWIHPELGFMNPGDFIPVFEKNGFIKNVDKFVLVEVCKILRRWLDEGKTAVPISVNLSRRDFEFHDLAERLIGHVDAYRLPHELVHFEVTESAFSDSPEQIAKTIRILHDSGFKIELDDFGAGYSSLTTLSEIDFDVLKLDMSIIKNDDPSSPRNVLDMCSHIMKQMNITAVAEGVENETQLNRIKEIGCDYIQGYYYSKPISVAEFEKYIEDEK